MALGLGFKVGGFWIQGSYHDDSPHDLRFAIQRLGMRPTLARATFALPGSVWGGLLSSRWVAVDLWVLQVSQNNPPTG